MLNMLLRAFFLLVIVVVTFSFLVFAFWIAMAILALYVVWRIYARFFKRKPTKPRSHNEPTMIDAEIVDNSWKNKR